MDRRDFLKAGIAGLVVGGCAAQNSAAPPVAAPRPQPLTEPEMRDFLANLDHGMESIDNGNPLGSVLKEAGVKLSPDKTSQAEELYRKSLRSLLVLGSFHDLPEASRNHPEVQKRIFNALPEMDQAVMGMADHLEKLSRDDQDAIRKKLQEQPMLPTVMVDALDRDAAMLGITTQRRSHLRKLTAQIGWRLRAQPISMLSDEYLSKVRAVAEGQNRAHLQVLERASLNVEIKESAANRVMGAGGIVLGLGIAGTLLGASIVDHDISGAFLITVGVLGILGGLITLLVGLIMKAAE